MDRKRIVTPRGGGALGQLIRETEYGPDPLELGEVPVDIRARYITSRRGMGDGAGVGPGGVGFDSSSLIENINRNVGYLAGVVTLQRGLLGRVETITNTPRLIIDQQEIGGRGYLLLNPAGVVGLTATVELFPSTTLIGATTSTSAVVGVANYKTARFFVTATFVAGVGPVTFDLQTKDPVTGTFITAQTIFSLAATGNDYADVGTNGIDTDFQILVTVPAGTTITFTLGAVLKDGLEGTTTGTAQTIFIGGAGVTSQAGYPILAGKEKAFYLIENVKLYAVTSGPTLDMNIFQL